MISGSISGADVKNLLSSMESTLGGLTGDTEMNLDDITVDFTYAVSKRIRCHYIWIWYLVVWVPVRVMNR